MSGNSLNIDHLPKLDNPQLILGFTGWMDGSEVSSGTLAYLIDKQNAKRFADIAPDRFYLYNFPGSMEFSSLFRPEINIKDGLIKSLSEPENVFYADQKHQLIYFIGKEPNLNWKEFGRSLFEVVDQLAVTEIYFAESVAGLVPHTRNPRLTCVVSHEELKPRLEDQNIKFTDYRGPGSFISYLLTMAAQWDVHMISLIAEIPAYIQGKNPRCIEFITRQLAGLLGLDLNLDDLRIVGDALEKKLDKVVKTRKELVEHIGKLEENYDKDVFDNEMGDLKEWLEQQGIRLD